MSDLTVILTEVLGAVTNNDDLEFKLVQAIKKVYGPRVDVHVSDVTSNKVCLDLTLSGFVEAKTPKAVQDEIIKIVKDYYGFAIQGVGITTTTRCTILEEVQKATD